MRYWQTLDITEYVIMPVIAKSGIDLNELENIEEDKGEKKITELRGL